MKNKFTVGVFGMIFDKDGRVLLAHRRDYDLWNLPGGGMNKANESVEEALVREVLEETGLAVKPLFLSGVYTKVKKSDLVFSFVCEVVGGELTETEEADALEYFDVDKLPENTVPKQVKRIKQYLKDKKYVHIETQGGQEALTELQQRNKTSTRKPLENYAFIDGQNLYKGVMSSGWELDYYRLRHYLRSKFAVREAFIFLGYIPNHKNLYEYLRKCGFELIFKKVAHTSEGEPKGNVDVDLTMHALLKETEYAKAIFITSDGDFAPLIKHLQSKGKFGFLLAPIKNKCSFLLKTEVQRSIVFLDEIRNKVSKMKRRPADR